MAVTEPLVRTVPEPALDADGHEAAAPSGRTLLLVGAAFQAVPGLADMAARAGWNVISRSTGSTAMSSLRERVPSAIALDVNIVDIDGWNFLAALKQDIELRHVPVLVSGAGDELPRALRLGAVGAFPLIADDGTLGSALCDLERWRADVPHALYVIGSGERVDSVLSRLNVQDWVTHFSDAADLTAALEEHAPDLLVVGHAADPGDHGRLQGWFQACPRPVTFPVLVAREQDTGELGGWEPFLETLPLAVVPETELLLDRISLMLHIPVAGLPPEEQQVLQRLNDPSEVLTGRRALIVDDDIRNIFAMTSVLERYGMDVLAAETGRDAIDLLESHGDVEVVLMDIMMPEMDGYETIREIRDRTAFRSLPIVAVTAKAMVGDRQKCREAGASDYIPKPVDTDQLVRVMASWLRQRPV